MKIRFRKSSEPYFLVFKYIATLDNRTRHTHAMLDRQKRKINKPFEVDGFKILYPGHPLAVGSLIYNCRCTIVANVEGVDTSDAMRRVRDPVTGRNVLVKDMSYKEWEAMKLGASTKANAQADKDLADFLGLRSINGLNKEIAHSTIKLQNGFACFPKDDLLNEYVKKVKPLKTYFDVAMHGTPSAVCFGTNEPNMNARMLAAVIRHSEGYNRQNIRLLSCSTGKIVDNEYCFAEELANALGVAVKAPNGDLFISPKGYLTVGKSGGGSFVDYKPNQRQRRK